MRVNLDIERTTGRRRAESEMWNEALGAWSKAHIPGEDREGALSWLGAVLKCLSIVSGRPITEIHAEWEDRRPEALGVSHPLPEHPPERPGEFDDSIEGAGRPPVPGSFARTGQDGVTRVGQARVAPTSIMGEPTDGAAIPSPD